MIDAMATAAQPFHHHAETFLASVAAFLVCVTLAIFIISFVESWNITESSSASPEIFLLLVMFVGTVAFVTLGADAALRKKTSPILLRAVLVLAPFLLPAALISIASPLIQAGDRLGSLVRLAQDETRFAAIVARLKAEQPSQEDGKWRREDGISLLVDRHPSLRVAFHLRDTAGGLRAIVVDPSRTLSDHDMQSPPPTGVQSARGRSQRPPLFGYANSHCLHLRDEFFRCFFAYE